MPFLSSPLLAAFCTAAFQSAESIFVTLSFFSGDEEGALEVIGSFFGFNFSAKANAGGMELFTPRELVSEVLDLALVG